MGAWFWDRGIFHHYDGDSTFEVMDEPNDLRHLDHVMTNWHLLIGSYDIGHFLKRGGQPVNVAMWVIWGHIELGGTAFEELTEYPELPALVRELGGNFSTHHPTFSSGTTQELKWK